MVTIRARWYQLGVKPCTVAPWAHMRLVTSSRLIARIATLLRTGCTSPHRNSNVCGSSGVRPTRACCSTLPCGRGMLAGWRPKGRQVAGIRRLGCCWSARLSLPCWPSCSSVRRVGMGGWCWLRGRRAWESRPCWSARPGWRVSAGSWCCAGAGTSWSGRSAGVLCGRCWRPGWRRSRSSSARSCWRGRRVPAACCSGAARTPRTRPRLRRGSRSCMRSTGSWCGWRSGSRW